MAKNSKTFPSYNNRLFLFVIVLFVFLSSTVAFGQNESVNVSNGSGVTNENTVVIETPVKDSSAAVINSNVNFILWFMGTKEDLGKSFSDDGISKKSILTSGREPNRLLVKTLLKKALNIKSC